MEVQAPEGDPERNLARRLWGGACNYISTNSPIRNSFACRQPVVKRGLGYNVGRSLPSYVTTIDSKVITLVQIRNRLLNQHHLSLAPCAAISPSRRLSSRLYGRQHLQRKGIDHMASNGSQPANGIGKVLCIKIESNSDTTNYFDSQLPKLWVNCA